MTTMNKDLLESLHIFLKIIKINNHSKMEWQHIMAEQEVYKNSYVFYFIILTENCNGWFGL
jgi:hypothetical protein